ncbi:MAG: HEAT repeat domain-containing protein [Endomicrobia bacterium]|nr:HEAT repeat domain-containing protein [Endomicrobiia bacterium]
MTNETNKTLYDNLLKLFRLSLTNLKIYPPNSPIIEKQLTELYELIKKIIQNNTFVTITEIDGKIFINEEEYSSKDPISISNINNLVQFFIQSSIKSITFKKELLHNELKDFFTALVQKKSNLTTKEIIKVFIEQNNIKNIAIDEVEFITVSKSDKTIKSILQNISQPINNFPELMSVLNTTLSELEKLPSEETKNRITSTIAKQISTLDTKIIYEFLTNPLPPKFEEFKLKQQIVNNLTKHNLEDIFNEVVEWCKKLKNRSESEIEYLENLQNLKDFIKLVVNSPVSEFVPIEIFEELFKIGLIDALPEDIKHKKEEQKSWIAQLDELLSTKEPQKLLQEKFLKNLQENIEKLCIIGLDDKLDNLINLMIENLSNPVIKIRQLTSSYIKDISYSLNKNNKSTLAKNLGRKLLSFLLKEKEEIVFDQYILSIECIFTCLIKTKSYSIFTDYCKQLLLFVEENNKTEQQKVILIQKLINRVFDINKDVILNDLIDENCNKYIDDIIWFLKYISENSIELIFNAILSTKNQKVIYKLLDLLNNIDNKQKILDIVSEYLQPTTSQSIIAKLLDLLNKINYDFSNNLKKIYPYLNYANKISVLNYIQQKPLEENLQWLVSLLSIKEFQLLEYLIDILTTLNYKPASKEILKLLNIKNSDIKKRICISLGILKETKAIPKLKKLVQSSPKLFGIIKGEEIETRIAACWALSNFLIIPEVKSFLQKISNTSKEHQLSNIAKEILSSSK